MKVTREILYLPLMLFAIWCPGSALFGETPGEAIDLALQKSYALGSIRNEIRAVEYELFSTRRSYLPVVSVGSSYLYNSAESEISLPPPPDTTISLVQSHNIDIYGGLQWVVFSGFSRSGNLIVRETNVELERNNRQSAEIQTALDTLVLYRQVQKARLQVEILSSGRDRISLQIDRLERLYDQGMTTVSDLLALRLNLLDYEQNIVSAEADLDRALLGLREKTGRDIQVGSPPERFFPNDVPGLDLSVIPELQSLSLQEDLAYARYVLERSAIYPKVALNSQLHYGIPGASPVENEWMLYGTAGIGVSWSTDWGAAKARAAAAEERKDALACSRTALASQTSLRYKQDLRELESMILKLDFLRKALDLTAEKTGITEQQYKQGMATVTDFTDATLALTQAELRYRTQILLILLKRNQLEATSGLLPDNWSVSR
jgi:outer membrane protein TolC